MQRSSDSIGTLAAALAKAQSEIANPEKSLTATIVSPFSAGRESDLSLCTALNGTGSRSQVPWPARDCDCANNGNRWG
jgi:hypothetical protein